MRTGAASTAGMPGSATPQAVDGSQSTGRRLGRTMGAQILVTLLNVATGVLTARLLGPDGRGIFAAVTLWPQLIATVAAGGLPFALIFFASGVKPASARRAIGATLLLGAASGAAGAAFGAVAIPYAMDGRYPDTAVAFAQATVVVAVINILVMLCRQALVTRGHLSDFNVSSWLDPAVYLLLLVSVAVVTPLTAELAAGCLYGAGMLGLGWTMRRLSSRSRPTLRGVRDWTPRIGAYATRALGTGVLSGLTAYLDRLVLVFVLPPRELGLYAVAFSLSRLANVVQNVIGAVVLPTMAASGAADAKALHDRTFRLVLAAMLLGAAAAFPLSQPALIALYGASFADAGPVLALLVLDAALLCLCQVVSQLFLTLGRPGYVSLVQALSFTVTVAGLVLLVPAMGAGGAALAVAAGSGLRLVALLAGIPLKLRLSPPGLTALPGDLRAMLRSIRP